MGRVLVDITTSLDGFVAGPNDGSELPLGEGGERLHQWVYNLASWREPHGLEGGDTNRDSEILEEAMSKNGAIVLASFRARERTCRARGDRGLRAACAARRGRGRGGSIGAANSPHGYEHLDPRRRRQERLRGDRDSGHRGVVLERSSRHVRDVPQVPVPAHVRLDPRGARRHGGARDGRGALDRHPGPASTAASRCSSRWSSGSTRRGGCWLCRSSAGLRASAGRASESLWRASPGRSRTSTTSSAPCSRRCFSLRGRSSHSTSSRVGRGCWPTSIRCTTASCSSVTPSSVGRLWRIAIHAMTQKLVD
jgi:hypothetical protein